MKTIDEYRLEIKTKGVKPVAADVVERIVKIDKDIHAFCSIESEYIKTRALEIQSQGVLSGVPVAVKDNICIKGVLTTCASKVLEGFKPPYNATVIEKLKKADALIVPRANMDEFAFGSSCETSCYGPTKNPHDLERIPGGSSGGSAASVASGEVPLAIGSDTGGSIRQPAAMCGVIGLKPTYGRVSRYGLIAFASSLDQIGTFSNNMLDCAELLEVIAGYDPKDSTSVNIDVPKYKDSVGKDIKGLKIGLPKEYFIDGIEKDIIARIEEAKSKLKAKGAEFIEISLPHTKYAVSCYYIIGPAEASSNLARYEGVHYGRRSSKAANIIEMYKESRNEGFGAEVKRRVLLGTYSLSSGYYDAFYLKAQKVRTKIADDFKKAFETCDCILTPTTPTTAFKIGEKVEDPLQMYLADIFTIPANLAGIPAMSVPCGKDSKKLPVGLQLMAKAFDEEMLLRVGSAI
ncbi:MAG: Asp-tRNA(Asn)/Glu-tRNA(Gln) amidotransferase subunit GatA [Candidatus Omnitrophica bacterium]|nr:Asp-tRNA(Asn)/Glu-tRNA(Gln) amidotransferase subunit GatA [Candidatus Omnitrophota bacterium]